MDRIQHQTATVDEQFTDGDVNQGALGTVVTAEWLNGVQEEIARLIERSDQTLDKNAFHQLEKAVRAFANYSDFFTDVSTGTYHSLHLVIGNSYPSEYRDGFKVRFIPQAANTGVNAYVSVGGLASIKVVDYLGATSCRPGLLDPGRFIELVYSEAHNVFVVTQNFDASLINSGTLALERLPANLNAETLGGQSSGFYRDASNLINGTIPAARLPSINAATLGGHASSVFFNASNLTAGTIPAARLPSIGGSEIAPNSISQSHLATNSVASLEIAVGAVHQSELSTSTGEISTDPLGNKEYILPGGEYGFYPQVRQDNAGFDVEAQISRNATNTTFTTVMYLRAEGSVAHARQRFINSSPPYDLGDGDVPLFVFIYMLNGKVSGVYCADVPPWGYNGPTDVRAKIDKFGKKYQLQRKIIDRESGEVEAKVVEMTHAIKNADMHLIPHPFVSNRKSGDQIILLDPPDTERLFNLHEAGESINTLLHDDYLRLDNTTIDRCCPAGVMPCKWKWKKTK